jgi:filamentous hemagglutinin family protein
MTFLRFDRFLLRHGILPIFCLSCVITFLDSFPFHVTVANGQSPPPITASGLNTQISGPIAVGGKIQFNITGGTRPGGGTNLFHSFGQFNVPNNNIANFFNETSLPTSNILARVTGTNGNNPTLSSILGTIQTTGFGNANLFLMNPAGFLFGPNATVNVGGMVAFTSADYLRLTELDGSNAGIFHADPAKASVLTSAPVAAFGFLGSNPGTITVQGSQLTVADGTGISLIGGNITIQSGTLDDGTVQPAQLTARAGQINLASVASPGEILHPSLLTAPNINGESFTSFGAISLTDSATLDVSGNQAGTVVIRGGQLQISNSTISADTGEVDGAQIGVDISLSGALSIANDFAPAITARTSGAGNAGEIHIVSGSLEATSNPGEPDIPLALIDSHTSGTGRGGNVTITTGDLLASTGGAFFIDSGSAGQGRGGNVTISGTNVHLQDALIATGDLRFGQFVGLDVSGDAGNLSIKAENLKVETTLSTDALNGRGGNITLEGGDIQITGDSFVSVFSHEGGSAITVKANRFAMDTFSVLENDTSAGQGGGTTITARVVELTNAGRILSSTVGDGNASDIRVTASDHVSLVDNPSVGSPSGLFSNSFGFEGTLGNAGSIVVTTPRLDISGGARIDSSTKTSGRGGDMTIMATDSVSISGARLREVPEAAFGLGGTRASGIYTRSVGRAACSGTCGDAGRIAITTGSLNLAGGAQINSGTTSTGQGGDITINATGPVSISGTLSDGTSGGIFSRTTGKTPDSGAGGNIVLTARQSVTLNNGSSISASSTGPGNTGNIQINAGNQFAMTNSTMTTEANQAGGGTIKITTAPSGTVQLTNSTISASVLNGAGGGGSVNIDPQYVILLNSQILAQAVQGPGGAISINITNGGLFLPDATSTVSASSQFGVDGTVTIQSPNAPAGGKIIPLSQKPLLATSLLNQRCASLAGGEFSSFTVAGRGSLPTEPGGWLASPMALSLGGTGDGTLAEKGGRAGIDDDPARETTILSLRQIAPAGFLTQSFAVEGSAGCQS